MKIVKSREDRKSESPEENTNTSREVRKVGSREGVLAFPFSRQKNLTAATQRRRGISLRTQRLCVRLFAI